MSGGFAVARTPNLLPRATNSISCTDSPLSRCSRAPIGMSGETRALPCAPVHIRVYLKMMIPPPPPPPQTTTTHAFTMEQTCKVRPTSGVSSTQKVRKCSSIMAISAQVALRYGQCERLMRTTCLHWHDHSLHHSYALYLCAREQLKYFYLTNQATNLATLMDYVTSIANTTDKFHHILNVKGTLCDGSCTVK